MDKEHVSEDNKCGGLEEKGVQQIKGLERELRS
jgi:hypothetical protein